MADRSKVLLSGNLPACTGGCAITSYTVAVKLTLKNNMGVSYDEYRDITGRCTEVLALAQGALATSQRYIP